MAAGDNFKVRTKPRKIVVEERNENNEIVRQIVEKARKRKVTALKKAILKKREGASTKKEPKPADPGETSGFETVNDDDIEAPRLIPEAPKTSSPS